MIPTDWIKNPVDINFGREFYKPHCKNAALYKLLSCRDSPGVRRFLLTEISRIMAVESSSQAIELRTTIERDKDNLPMELKPLDVEWKKMYKEASYLQQQLSFVIDKDDRCKKAHQILYLFDQISLIWNRMDHFRKNNKFPDPLPDPAVITETDPLKLKGMLLNLRANISKAKNKPDKLEKLKIWEIQKKQLEEKLNIKAGE
jgi:hypothetical protein